MQNTLHKYMVFLAIYFTASGWFFPPCLSYHPHYQALDHGLPEEIQEYGEYSHYNPYHAEMVVDSKGRYLLEYTVDYNAKTITFNLTVHTTGWVGIGLSKDGTMKDADIMVGWVDSYDHGYLMDLHSDYNRKLLTDSKQNWNLVDSCEKNGYTNLVISRPLDTCDPQDYPITVDLVWVLWAYGETDELEYHFDKRGSFRAYLLDPVLITPEPHLESFRIVNEITLEPRVTSYICSIHKGPHLLHKHHMVEFQPYFENSLSEKHAHHMIVYRCVAPPGMDPKDIFEPLLGYPGEECYFSTSRIIPIQLCRIIVGGWAVGGQSYKWPYSTGIPMGESFYEYYMLELHFDNPETLALPVTAGMGISYTNRLRKNDGGVFIVGYDILGMFIIPPVTPSFEVYSFCSESCIRSMTPESGYEILGVLMHTHLSGRKVKLQHFRNGTELEWILKDDNYDHMFQPVRILYEPRLVLPGDLLSFKCEYDDTWTNVTTLSGFAKIEEMCTCSLLITKRLPYYFCNSQVPQEHLLPFIGAEECAWNMETGERTITAPPNLAGQDVSVVADSIDWTKSLRYRLQETQLKTPSTGSCPQILLPSATSTTSSQSSHHHVQHRSTEEDKHLQHAAAVEAEMQKLLGTVISSSADKSDILRLAKGYGEATLMGDITLPNRTPGPISTAQLPAGNRFVAVRTCPRVTLPYSHYANPSGAAGTGAANTGASYQSTTPTHSIYY